MTQRTSYLTLLDQTFHRLAENPDLGRVRQDIRADLRSYPCKKQVIFYRRAAHGVEVLRMLHHARDARKTF